MVENRTRIEKQILLGRQSVHKAVKHKSLADARHLLLQRMVDNTASQGIRSVSLSPLPSGSDCLPLSVDTDAEAVFAKASPFYRRGRVSNNISPNHRSDTDVPLSLGIRRKRSSHLAVPTVDEDDPEDRDLLEAVPNGKLGRSEIQNEASASGGFLSRFRNNSISRMSLPSFSVEHPPSRTESSPEHRGEHNWSSESSSDEDYPSLDIVS